MNIKRILVTGATGAVGSKLVLRLLSSQYDVVVLSRSVNAAKKQLPLPVSFYEWSPQDERPPLKAFEDVDAVIHLAGESVSGSRWTKKRKLDIAASREIGTRHLVEAMESLSTRPRCFISASAVGFYGERGEEALVESSVAGRGFLPELCEKWEHEAALASRLGMRTVQLRIGIVLDPEGGALKQMQTLFRMGVGGKIGSGQQWMSWIHIDDLVDLLVFSLTAENLNGPVNAVSPNAVTNAEFTKQLALACERPALLSVPAVMLKMIFGELSQIVLSSQKVLAQKALEHGFTFRFPELSLALGDLLRVDQRHAYRLRTAIWVPSNQKEVFHYFSLAENLEELTPPWLNFKIKKKSSEHVQEGMLLDYSLRVRGVPVKWKTLIEQWAPPQKFVDRQLKGPYRLWLHEHRFFAMKHGTLMTDVVAYRLPFGILGDLVHLLWVGSDVAKIFQYRSSKILSRFGS